MHQKSPDRISPFDWERFTQRHEPGRHAGPGRGPASREERPLSADERARRILAVRWGSPYSKALPSARPAA